MINSAQSPTTSSSSSHRNGSPDLASTSSHLLPLRQTCGFVLANAQESPVLQMAMPPNTVYVMNCTQSGNIAAPQTSGQYTSGQYTSGQYTIGPTTQVTQAGQTVLSPAYMTFQPQVYYQQVLVPLTSVAAGGLMSVAAPVAMPGPAAPLRADTPASSRLAGSVRDPELTISQQQRRQDDDVDNDDSSEIVNVDNDDDDEDEEEERVPAMPRFSHPHPNNAILARMLSQHTDTPDSSVSGPGDPTETTLFDMEDDVPEELAMKWQSKLTHDVCAERIGDDQVIYVCRQHNMEFKYRRHLEQHFLLHRCKERPALCHHCGKCFTRADHLNRHASTHGEWALVCQLCGEDKFERPSHLYRHWRKIHPHLEEPINAEKADSSSSVTSSSGHVSSETPPVSPQKTGCGGGGDVTTPVAMPWTTMAAMKRRRSSSAAGGTAAKRPADPASLARYHAAGYVAQLASTMQPPTENGGTRGKQYTCALCQQQFARQAHLQRHQRIHTGERPFKCLVCQDSFARGDYLQQHLVHQHNDTPMECEMCHQHFQFIKDLFDHNKEQHRSYKPWFLRDNQTASPLATVSNSAAPSQAPSSSIAEEPLDEPIDSKPFDN